MLFAATMPKDKSKKCLKVDVFVGTPKRSFSKDHLPSKQEVLQVFKYQREVLKKSEPESCKLVASLVFDIWTKAGRKAQVERNIVRVIRNLVARWVRSKKLKAEERKEEFKLELMALFDVSPFHTDPRSSVQSDITESTEKENVSDTDPLPDKEEGVEDQKDPTYEDHHTGLDAPKKRIDVVTDVVVENLDRERVSNRGAVGILSAVAASVGCEVENLNISKSTVQRKRKQVIVFH